MIVVSSPEVKNPVAVRYAWANAPEANLYNAAGLPAAPFRTDAWERVPPEKQNP
jgi:sialate O-acetylesterase